MKDVACHSSKKRLHETLTACSDLAGAKKEFVLDIKSNSCARYRNKLSIVVTWQFLYSVTNKILCSHSSSIARESMFVYVKYVSNVVSK